MDDALRYLRDRRQAHLDELIAYLRIPSISSESTHAANVAHCAEYTAGLLRDIGAGEVQVHATPGHPIITGRLAAASPDRPTVLFYGHYDVQPVDPLALWEQDPFDPHVRDERLVARGAADDKGQLFMHLKALQALQATAGAPPVNVLFLIEGEEEIGSPNLLPFMTAQRAWLANARVALISDSPMWAEGQPAITVGLRGLVLCEATVTVANRDLHSGSYGGAVANPLEVMARLLAGLKDADGRVTIPGFYEEVRELTDAERTMLAAIPFDEAAYLADLGVTLAAGGERDRSLLERIWFRPTLEINGLWGGYIGPGAKTVLPAQAHAKLSMRLVPDQDPATIVELVMNHLRCHLPAGARLEVRRIPGGGRPIVVADNLPAMAAARRALQESFGVEPLLLREGGSIPVVADLQTLLGLPTLLIGFCLPDARAHSPNENLHLPTFHTGTESLVRLYHGL